MIGKIFSDMLLAAKETQKVFSVAPTHTQNVMPRTEPSFPDPSLFPDKPEEIRDHPRYCKCTACLWYYGEEA